MADKKVTTVYQTDDYKKFKIIDGNRPIDHAKKIIESIKEIGMLWQPILVNERFEIVDGQGRFLAMKTLKLPIIYIKQDGLTIREVRYLNKNATNWKVDDYIHSYAVGDDAKDSYRNLEVVKQQFPEFSQNTVMKAASKYGLNTYRSNVIKDGTYDEMDFVSMNNAIRRLTKLREVAQILPHDYKFKSVLLHGVIFCEYIAETDANFSIDQLIDAIKKNYRYVEPARNISLAISNLNYMYNYKRSEKNRYNIVRKYEDVLAEIRSTSGTNTLIKRGVLK